MPTTTTASSSSSAAASSTSAGRSPSPAAGRKPDHSIEYLVAGGSAGAIARTCVAPIERCGRPEKKHSFFFLLSRSLTQRRSIKIIFQINKGGQYRHLLQQLVGEEGFLALWKGNSAAVIRVVPYTATTFLAYEQYKVMFGASFQHRGLTESVAGAAAGVTAVALTYPLDLVRARLAMQANGKLASARYTGVLNALLTIPRTEGFAALYRGIAPTMCGVAPYAAIKFSAFEALKRAACVLWNVADKDLPIDVRMTCGGLAGLFAQTFTYPFDVLRRREQTHSGARPYSNVFSGMLQLAQQEGVRRGLYRGLSLNYLKTLPNVMIYMSLYDVFKRYLVERKDARLNAR